MVGGEIGVVNVVDDMYVGMYVCIMYLGRYKPPARVPGHPPNSRRGCISIARTSLHLELEPEPEPELDSIWICTYRYPCHAIRMPCHAKRYDAIRDEMRTSIGFYDRRSVDKRGGEGLVGWWVGGEGWKRDGAEREEKDWEGRGREGKERK